MSNFNNASLIVTPNAYKSGKLYAIKPTSGAGDLTVTRATSATRVNSAGLIESVGANIARLDYTNGSCPSILVEPQRTNLVLGSEDFNNINWFKTNATITQNTTISPSGVQNADTITVTSIGNIVAQIITVTASTTYTLSFYVLRGSMTDLKYSVYNLSGTANIVAPTSYYSQTSASNWVRVSVTFTTPVGCTSINIYPIRDTGAIGTVFLWGAQLEAGSNATSYIPTTTTSVTRNADLISKSGISSLIGQTEGTLYWEGFLTRNASIGRILVISEATLANRVILNINNNRIEFINRANSSINGSIGASSLSEIVTGLNKIAVGYKSGNTALYVNGVLAGTSTQTFNYSLTMPNFYFVRSEISEDIINTAYVKSAMLFKTRLTNTELQQLTTL